MRMIEKRKKVITFAVLLMFIFLVQTQAPAQDYSKKSPGGMVEKEGQSPRSNHSKKKRTLWPYIIGGAVAAGIVVLVLGKKAGDDNSGPITSIGWGKRGSGPGEFNRPETVCLDARGYVYVIDGGNSRIQKFDRNGKYIAELSCVSARGMTAFDEKLYVLCDINSTAAIVILSLKLEIIGEWHINTGRGSNPVVGGDIAVDAIGTFYITDRWNHRIIKLNHNGQVIKTWGSQTGSGTSLLNNPSGLMVTRNEVFVSDSQNHRILVFDTEGNYRREWRVGGGDVRPHDLALWGNDRLLVIRPFVPIVSHIYHGSIEKYDLNGTSLGLLDGGPDYYFTSPAGLAVNNAQSKVYVSDYELHKIFVIDLY